MTTYRVLVADPLLEQKDFWEPVEGLRLVSVDGPWLGHPYVTICTFEDNNAPSELEGKLIEPVFTNNYETGTVTITERNLVPAAEAKAAP